MKVQRYKCMNDQCTYDQQERIPFAIGSCNDTHRFARYVIDLQDHNAEGCLQSAGCIMEYDKRPVKINGTWRDALKKKQQIISPLR